MRNVNSRISRSRSRSRDRKPTGDRESPRDGYRGSPRGERGSPRDGDRESPRGERGRDRGRDRRRDSPRNVEGSTIARKWGVFPPKYSFSPQKK